jgi:hypothetical protein
LQDALTMSIFGGGMLPPNPEGVDKAYEQEVGAAALKLCTHLLPLLPVVLLLPLKQSPQ